MSDGQLHEIRLRLDDDLSIASFERDYRSTGEAATEFFQDALLNRQMATG